MSLSPTYLSFRDHLEVVKEDLKELSAWCKANFITWKPVISCQHISSLDHVLRKAPRRWDKKDSLCIIKSKFDVFYVIYNNKRNRITYNCTMLFKIVYNITIFIIVRIIAIMLLQIFVGNSPNLISTTQWILSSILCEIKWLFMYKISNHSYLSIF